MLQSSPGFFNVGLTIAAFSDAGTMPVDKDDLIMEVINGVKAGRQVLTREVGIGVQVACRRVRLGDELKDRLLSWKTEDTENSRWG